MNKVLRTGGAGGKKSPKIIADNLLSKDVVEFTLGLCEGPIGGLVSGPRSFYLDDTPLVSPLGDNNFEPFELHLYHGSENASVVRNVLGGITSNQQVGVELATNSPVIRVTPSSLSNEIDQLEVRLLINSLVRSTSKGDQLDGTIDFRIEYRQSGTSGWLNFNGTGYTETYVSGYTESQQAKTGDTIQTPIYSTVTHTDSYRITGKTTGGYARDFIKQVPRIDGDWEVRVTLLTDTTDPMISVSMSWESLQSVTVEHRSYDNLAVARGLGQASDQFSGIPRFSGIYACLLVKVPSNFDPITRFYNGVWDGTFKIAHTDDPAWILYDLCDHPVHGLRRHIPELLLDRYSFYEASQWCNQLVPIPNGGSFQPRYTYNGVASSMTNGIELVTYVASSFNAVFLTDMNGTIRIAVDQPGQMVQIFAPESVGEEGFQYQFTEIMQRYNDIEVEFINPDLGWEPDRRRVFNQGYIDANGVIPLKMVAIGCNNVHEAQRRAQLRLLQANTELSTVSFQTARAGISLELFDLIGISDPDVGWGISGRIKSVVGNTINLRDELMLPVGEALELVVQTTSGPVAIEVTSPTPTTQTLNFTNTWPDNVPSQAQFSIASPATGFVKPFRIVAIKPNDEDPESMAITAIEVNVNKYGDADQMESTGTVDYTGVFSVIPETPTITSVQSGTGQLLTQAGSVSSRIRVEWNTNPRSTIRQVLVYYRRVNSGAFQMITAQGSQAYIGSVQDGEIYEIYLEGVNSAGVRSASSGIVAHRVVGKTEAPTSVTNLYATSQMQAVWLTWDANNDADFSHFEIVDRAAPEILTDATVPDYQSPANQFLRGGLGNAIRRYFWVRSVDTSGNVSPWTGPVDNFTLTLGQIEALAAVPTGLVLTTDVLDAGVTSLVYANWNDVIGAVQYEVGIRVEGADEFLRVSGSNSYQFQVRPGLDCVFRVRSVNGVGSKSEWSTAATIISGIDTVAPSVPIGLTTIGGLNSVWVEWTPNLETDLAFYEIYYDTTDAAPLAATPAIYQTQSNFTVINNLVGPDLVYLWLRAVDTSGNRSAWSVMASVAPEVLDMTIAEGEITSAMFASTIRPVELFDALPGEPHTQRVGYLTTDGQIYRNDGTGWSAAVPAEGITGKIVTGQIAAGAIRAEQIAADAIVASKIAAGTITGEKLAATNIISSSAQIGDLVVTNANIDNLTVGGEKIQNGAITSAAAAYGGGGGATDWATIAQFWATTEGGRTFVAWAQIESTSGQAGSEGTDGFGAVRMIINGSVVYTSPSVGTENFPIIRNGTSAAGSTHVAIEGRKAGGDGSFSSTAFIVGLEFKK